ncbi:MAG: hypothetical protein V1836_01690 [Candidatus Aenigmatarchaeota archaeon]
MLLEYLKQPQLVADVLGMEELKTIQRNKNPVQIMMGQTYDRAGQPFDMMKYSLFMMNFQDILAERGVESNAGMLLADHFLTDINKDMTDDEACIYGIRRWNFLDRINFAYKGKIHMEFSSALRETPEYQQTLNKLKQEMETNPRFASLVSMAVPEDRRNNKDSINYPLEELASIAAWDTDIKVGPPYEAMYDKPARRFGPAAGLKKYAAIHLTEIQPLGDTEEEIPFGLLPYKLSSKGMQERRICLDPFDGDKARYLIRSSKNRKAVEHVLVTADLARQRVENDIRPFSTDGMSDKKLKNMALSYLNLYVANFFA